MKKYPKDNERLVYDAYSKFLEDVKKDTRRKNGKMPKYVQNGFIIGSMIKGEPQVDKNGEIIWDQKIKDSVRKVFNYKQVHVVRQNVINNGEFYNQTIFSKDDNKKKIPLKKGLDTSLYGGYSGENNSYSLVVAVDEKAKLVGIPVRIASEVKNGNIILLDWLKENIKYKQTVEILIDRVPKYQRIISPEKGDIMLTSAKEMINNTSLYLPKESVALLSLLENSKVEKHDKIMSSYGENVFVDMYVYLLEKMKSQYQLFPGELSKLNENFEAFRELERSDQYQVIEQLMTMLHTNSSNANLKFGNIKNERFGRKKSTPKLENVDFIYESPTGLFDTKKHIE